MRNTDVVATQSAFDVRDEMPEHDIIKLFLANPIPCNGGIRPTVIDKS